MLCAAESGVPARRDAHRCRSSGPRQRRQRAARRRQSVRSPLGPAVHRRRPEARRRDRHADRHGDPERAARARVARPAAARAGDAARARPADEAPAATPRTSRRRRPSRRASCRPRASAATSTTCSGSAGGRTGVMIGDVSGHGYQAALIMALTMSASAIHAQGTDDPGARCCARLYASVKEELDDHGDVHLGVLRRRRPRARASCATRTPGIRTRSSSRATARSSGSSPAVPPLGMADEAPASVTRARGTSGATSCCSSPTASPTRATATGERLGRGTGARRRA